MGKLKIAKQNKKTSSGMPNWLLTTIIIVVIVAVLATCLLSIFSANGIVLRSSMAMRSDDYRVNGSMMKYYYVNTYNNFLNNYSSYLSYLSIGSSTPISEHDNITFGGTAEEPNTYDAMFLGSFTGTWFDYFAKETNAGVKTLLFYCEKADDLGIFLTKEEKKEINDELDASIQDFREQLEAYGWTNPSDSTCLSNMYGEGVSKSDIRKAMRIAALAAKAQEQVQADIETKITDAALSAEYDKNNQKYDKIDYISYTFSVSYNTAVEAVVGEDAPEATITANKDKIEAKYKELIEEAKKNAEELSKQLSASEFKAFLYNYIANKNYDDLLSGKKLASDKLPSEDDLKIIKQKLIAAVVEDLKNGKTEATTDVVDSKVDGATVYTVYEKTVSKEFADAIKSVKNSLFSSAGAVDEGYTYEGTNYVENDDFSTWAFSADRKENETKVIKTGDGSKEGEFKVDTKSFSAKTYIITKPRYQDTTVTKDVAYMTFSSEDTAKAAIEALKGKGTLTKDIFDAVATEKEATNNILYENYRKGEIGNTVFDTWLFTPSVKPGAFTENPITMSEGYYLVAYYVKDGKLAWQTDVENALLTEAVEKAEKEMEKAYGASIASSPWTMKLIVK